MSEGGSCSGCGLAGQVAALEARVSQLEAEVDRLQRENERLRQIIERLRRIIQQARAACAYYIQETMKVLGQKSGIQRAVWAYNKGGYKVARNLLAILSQGQGG
ncbi:MAG: hypothetical protein GWN58_58055 [Anaerolineae bacterium]|nr:hypothetical protein [Anaerolineae bacterium]